MTTVIDGFDWDAGNRAKCQKHGVSVAAIEGMFLGPIAILPDPGHSNQETRLKAIGFTTEGRAVFLIFTERRAVAAGWSGRSAPVTCMRRRSGPMKKRLPALKSDRAAEAFVAEADLSAYDLSGLRLVRYELKPKNRAISVRLPDELLKAVRLRAKRAGVPYQRFIRIALERAVQDKR
jgi:predicted DNA binding CopG/RHH family protein/uncharacterized DUF497 family protein